MKLFPPHRLAPLLAAALCLALPPAVRAQTTVLPDNGADAPAATPRPRPRPAPTPAPDPSQPVATVNGEAVYRPLMKSLVSDPVNRALIIRDFTKRGNSLSKRDVDQAVVDFERRQFQGSDAQLDAKLKTLGATRADYRQYVAEEVKLRTVLRVAPRGYVAGLRARATVNAPQKQG